MKDDTYIYEKGKVRKGFKVEIVGFTESKKLGLLSIEEVVVLLDKLPVQFYETVPLTRIIFDPKEKYSVIKSGKLLFVDKEEIGKGEIVSRLKMMAGPINNTGPSSSIVLSSTKNWEGKNDKEKDKSEALLGIANGLGHLLLGTILYGKENFLWCFKVARFLPRWKLSALDLLKKIFKKDWMRLPLSELKEYHEYERVFEKIKKYLKETGGRLSKLTHIERMKMTDFEISFAQHLIFGDLEKLDERRYHLIMSIINYINSLEKRTFDGYPE